MKTKKYFGAFTLVEILVALGILGALSGVGYQVVTGTRDAVNGSKLQADVEALNRAIDLYRADGGIVTSWPSASGSKDQINIVLASLKSRMSSSQVQGYTGFTGSYIDQRIDPDDTAVANGKYRAYWDGSKFVLTTTGAGISAFNLNPSLAANAPTYESTRRTQIHEGAVQAKWVWDNTPQAADNSRQGTTPGVLTSGSSGTSAGGGSGTSSSTTAAATTLQTLQPPTFNPSGGTSNLSTFPLSVTITNPNSSAVSQVYYSTDGNTYRAYTGSPVSLNPGPLYAVAVSLDPIRYTNSSATNAAYVAQPTVTWTYPTSLYYGNFTDGTNISVSCAVNGSGNFTIHYTTDGSVPTASSANYTAAFSLNAGMWTSSSLILKAIAFVSNSSPYYVNSNEADATISANSVTLHPPTITPGSTTINGNTTVNIAKSTLDPAGISLYYRQNSSTCSTTDTAFSGNFIITNLGSNATSSLAAIAAVSTNMAMWFSTSDPSVATYTSYVDPYAGVDGVLIGGGLINNNASLNGSIIIVKTSGTQPNITFNNNASEIGDIYAPGTPTVTGVSANKVVDLTGATVPTGYTISFANNAVLKGHVYRRAVPVTMPTVSLPTGLVERGNATTGTLLPGHYTNVTTLNQSSITLGVAGSTTPSVYSFDNLSLANGVTVNIVGPVQLTINPGAGHTVSIQNNVVFGNAAHPDWLALNMYTGNMYLGNNGYYYGTVLDPNGTVTFDNNSFFNGAVTAATLNIYNNGSGVVFSLPPPGS